MVPVNLERNQAVVTSTDWTTETIIHLLERKTIELDPSFQRREAWTLSRKSKFIESLIMGLPIPEIVLAEKKGKPGQFIVIDGKQRLLTLQQFVGSQMSQDVPPLVLSGIPTLTDLNGKTYEQLQQEPCFTDHLESFRSQPIRAVVVKNWPDENFLYLVFLRLNTGSVPLAPQELRQALHPGPFLVFANKRSADSKALQACLRIDKPDFRMRDVELMVRFFAFKKFMAEYRGNMKKFLDETCKELNEQWISDELNIHHLADEMDTAIAESQKVFPKGKLFSIWLGSSYEGRFNRTVFDIFVYYLSNPKVRRALVGRHKELDRIFQKLCTDNKVFLQSLQVTTKSLGSVHTRFSIFGKEITRLTNIRMLIPKLAK